jgi:hypothetical protein
MANNEIITKQLERILNSKYFYRSPRISILLKYIVESSINDNADKLKEYTIAKDIFQLDDFYNNQLNPIVRTTMNRLRKKLTDYYQDKEQIRLIMITIPNGRYIPSFYETSNIIKEKNSIVNNIGKNIKGISTIENQLISLNIVAKNNIVSEKDFNTIQFEINNLLIYCFKSFDNICIKNTQEIVESFNPGADYNFKFTLTGQNNNYWIYFYLEDQLSKNIIWCDRLEYKNDTFKFHQWANDKISNITEIIAGKNGLLHQHFTSSKRQPDILRKRAISRYFDIFSNLGNNYSVVEAKELLQEALKLNPDDITLLSYLSETSILSYIFQDFDNPELIKLAKTTLNRASNIENKNELVQMALLRLNYLNRDIKRTKQLTNQLINSANPLTRVQASSTKIFIGDWETKNLGISDYPGNLNNIPTYQYLMSCISALKGDFTIASEKMEKLPFSNRPFFLLSRIAFNNLSDNEERASHLKKEYFHGSINSDLAMSNYFDKFIDDSRIKSLIKKGLDY